VLVRKALQLATDRELINNAVLFGQGSIAADIPIPPTDAHATGLEAPAYDPERAKELLDQAGFPDGLEVTLHTSTISAQMVDMAIAFKESAAAAGIEITIQQAPEDSYWSDVWLTEPFTPVTWNGRSADQALSIVYLSEIHEMLLEDVPRIIPVFRPVLVGLKDNVRGLQAHPNNWMHLHEVWIDA
jgi:peptide/nickel transport system substrate-binding protein